MVENAKVVGEHLLGGLGDLAREFPGQVSNVRGRGLFIAFDLADTPTRNRVLAAMTENDLLALTSGHTAIRFRPPLNLSKDEADEGIRRLRHALAGALGAA